MNCGGAHLWFSTPSKRECDVQQHTAVTFSEFLGSMHHFFIYTVINYLLSYGKVAKIYFYNFHKLYFLTSKRDSFLLICIQILLMLLIIASDKQVAYTFKGVEIFVQNWWPSDEDGVMWSSSWDSCYVSLSLWLWVQFQVGQSFHMYPLCTWE